MEHKYVKQVRTSAVAESNADNKRIDAKQVLDESAWTCSDRKSSFEQLNLQSASNVEWPTSVDLINDVEEEAALGVSF